MPFAAKISLLSNSIPVNCSQGILANVLLTAILFTSDEAHFHLTGCVNKQNFRCWAVANPLNFTRDRFIVRELRFVCCRSIWCFRALLFPRRGRQRSNITSDRYIETLENFLQPQLNELAADVENIWFQQDGPLRTQYKQQFVT